MDFTNLGDVTFRALISLFTLFIITKILGKKQISEMSMFDYVIGISIGNFAAEMTINLESPEINGIFAVIVFGLIAYTVSFITIHSITLRRFFIGTPTIIMQDGKFIKNNMKKVHVDVNDLLEEARIKGYFDINEINYAVMEANGEMSFLPKVKYKNITVGDMNIDLSETTIVGNIIVDGKILESNLKLFNKSKKWLLNKINNYNIKDILLCTITQKGEMNIYTNENTNKILNVLE